MKVLVCFIVFCVYWVISQNQTCNCGWRNTLSSKRIVGGKETRKNEYPWTVYMTNECGGSIITEYHVLTAAHCTDRKKPKDFQVLAGMHFRKKEKNENLHQYEVAKIIQHKGYSNKHLLNDISVLLLSKRITFNQYIGPVCMPSNQFNLIGKFVKITGWGMTRGQGDETVLNEVDVQVVGIKKCQERWTSLVNVSSSQICAYTSGKDSCYGDSGGGLVYEDPNFRKYILVGLVSFGPEKCGSDLRPSVNTDVYFYMDWTEKVIADSQPEVSLCKLESLSQEPTAKKTSNYRMEDNSNLSEKSLDASTSSEDTTSEMARTTSVL